MAQTKLRSYSVHGDANNIILIDIDNNKIIFTYAEYNHDLI